MEKRLPTFTQARSGTTNAPNADVGPDKEPPERRQAGGWKMEHSEPTQRRPNVEDQRERR